MNEQELVVLQRHFDLNLENLLLVLGRQMETRFPDTQHGWFVEELRHLLENFLVVTAAVTDAITTALR